MQCFHIFTVKVVRVVCPNYYSYYQPVIERLRYE